MKIWFSVSVWTQRGGYVGYFNMIQEEGQIIHLISLRIRYTLNTMLEKGFGPPGRGWVMIHILSFLIGWSQVRS